MKPSGIKPTFLATAAAVTLTVFASQAHATYEGCMKRNADPIGCWLSEKLGGEYIHGEVPKPDAEEFQQIEKLRAAGHMKLDSASQKPHQQICETGKIIKMIEDNTPAEKIAKSCYK